jgi:hypothetical protein
MNPEISNNVICHGPMLSAWENVICHAQPHNASPAGFMPNDPNISLALHVLDDLNIHRFTFLNMKTIFCTLPAFFRSSEMQIALV